MPHSPTLSLHKISAAIDAKRKKENFPVASWFLPARARKGVLALYRFARHADDIADSPVLTREEKIAALSAADQALIKGDVQALPEWARAYSAQIEHGNVGSRHGRALLSAFLQDAEKGRYADWRELIDYCMRSASPVGRAVLELHREWRADMRASDTLCNALQILNHVQDLKQDYLERKRIYLPIGWLENPDHLSGDFISPDIRRAVDKTLEEVDAMLREAAPLPRTISSFRLRAEICTILNVATVLRRELQECDPIGIRVKLSRTQKLSCLLRGASQAATTLPARGSGFSALRAAKTSFFWPIARLPKEKREAMAALYAFCRITDDAVDEAPSAAEAQQRLTFWRHEIGALYSEALLAYPSHHVTRALMPAIRRFRLKREHFEGILDGLAMDVSGQMVKPSAYVLDRYCYGVASCVGLLSAAIFGYTNPQAEEFAIHLGKAFQYINILRDVQEDAARGRIYLPQELLTKHGLAEITPETLATKALELRPVLAELGNLARSHLTQSDEFLPPEDRATLAPALAMRRIYVRYLDMLEAQNWDITAPRVRLSGWKKLKLALK